jgi:hypothetical protein
LREPAPAAQVPADVAELHTEVVNWTSLRDGVRVAYTRNCGG